MGVLRDRAVFGIQVLAGIGLTVVAPAIWAWKKLVGWGKTHKGYVKILVVAFVLLYLYPWIVSRLQVAFEKIPLIPWQVIAGMAGFGILCLGLASLLFVGFRFLAAIVSLELDMARGLQGMGKLLADRFKMTEDQPGAFIPTDDEKLARMEEVRKLRDSGMIKEEDMAEFMRVAYSGGPPQDME